MATYYLTFFNKKKSFPEISFQAKSFYQAVLLAMSHIPPDLTTRLTLNNSCGDKSCGCRETIVHLPLVSKQKKFSCNLEGYLKRSGNGFDVTKEFSSLKDAIFWGLDLDGVVVRGKPIKFDRVEDLSLYTVVSGKSITILDYDS